MFSLFLFSLGPSLACDLKCDYEAYCGPGDASVTPETVYSDTQPQDTSFVQDYVLKVMNRDTKLPGDEIMPGTVGKGLILVYGGDLLSSSTVRSTQADGFKSLTFKYGKKYSSRVVAEVRPQICDFIKTYGIAYNIADKPVSTYVSMNEFFARKLVPSARPMNDSNPNTIVSPADCRILTFPNMVIATTIWIKGKNFKLSTLLKNDPRWVCEFARPSILISRLAPQDYHRFHSPVDAVVGRVAVVCGEYWSVNPAAVNNEHISVFSENKRAIVELLVNYPAGHPLAGTLRMKVLFIAVGATNVASINLHFKEGDVVKKGEDFGFFAFGGSTVLLLFPENAVFFDDDLVNYTTQKMETLVKVREKVGVMNANYTFVEGSCAVAEAVAYVPLTCAASISSLPSTSFLVSSLASLVLLLQSLQSLLLPERRES